MDGWGALSMLIRRQQADKIRKAEIRNLYSKKKKSYIQPTTSSNQFDFPELTPVELEEVKNQIRKDIKKKRAINFISTSILFIIALFGIIYLFLKKGIL